MGRSNLDYKLKDKRLTKSKKNAKLNKSIAFALAGMSSISLGYTLTETSKEASAMSYYETFDTCKTHKKLSNPKVSNEFKHKGITSTSKNSKFKY